MAHAAKPFHGQLRHMAPWLASLLMALSLAGCYYGSPSSASSSLLVYPADKAELYSDDGVMHVEIEAGTVSVATRFSITRIPQAKYPDQVGRFGLLSDVYILEPARPLNKYVRITFDLTTLKSGDKSLVKWANQNAFAIRAITPGDIPDYVTTTEPAIGDVGKQTLYTTSLLPGTYGVYWHECYKLCEKIVTCDSGPYAGSAVPDKTNIASCMTHESCPDDLTKMNGTAMQNAFYCSLTHPCADSYGCCLESDACSEADGDVDTAESEADADSEPEATESEADGDTVEPDSEAPETEADSESDSYEPLLCAETASACLEGQSCFTNALLDSGHCLTVAAGSISGYLRDSNGYTVSTTEPDLSCVAVDPDSATTVPYTLAVQTGDWWALNDPAGITVRYYQGTALAVPTQTQVTNSSGYVEFAMTASSEWFVLRMERSDTSADREVVPTWEFGYYVPVDVARAANNASRAVTVDLHPVTRKLYNSYAVLLGFSGGMPSGTGMVMGQIVDCSGTPQSLANVSMGLGSLEPKAWGYLDTTLSQPMPLAGQLYTGASGLFVGLYLPYAEQLAAFAVGRVQGTPTLVGWVPPDRLQLLPDSVSIFHMNRTY